ncbi:DUF748 domain-containing protein [Craterilacuibacter sp.]|uniref:DUF748 domain-containing protein n=1 Tax=Craterilacuibacter sp. TaxID=2870909 RepID=UPI003F35C8E1
MTQAASERPAAPALWPRLIAKILLLVLVLLALVWGGLYALAPGMVQKAASDWAQGIGYRLKLGQVDIAPWSMRVELGQVSLSDAQGAPLFSADKLVLNAEPWALLAGRWQLSELSLGAPKLSLARGGDGVWNWARLIEAASPKSAAPKQEDDSLPSLLIEALRIRQGQVVVDDAQATGSKMALTPFDLTLNDLSSAPGKNGRLHLDARLNDGARLAWQGQIGLAPLASQGEITLQQLKLASVWPWVQSSLNLAAPKGAVSLTARYRFAMPDAKPELILPDVSLTASALEFKAPGSGHPLRLNTLAVTGGSFVLDGLRARVHDIRLDGLQLHALRDGKGQLDWLAALPAAKTVSVAPAKPSPGLSLALDRVALSNAGFTLDDAGFVRPLRISGQLPALSAAIRLSPDGALQVEDIHGQLSGLALQSAEARWLQLASIKLEGARLDTGKALLDAGKLALAGLQLELEQTKNGRLNVLDALQIRKPAVPAKAEAAGNWQIALPQVALAGGSVRWRDEAMATPLTLALTDLAGELTPEGDALALALAGQLEGGRVAVKGKLDTVAARGKLQLMLNSVPLRPLAPYVLAGTPLTLRSGNASAQLDAAWQGARWQLAGKADIARLAVMEPGQKQPLLAWQRLQVSGIQADARATRISEVRLTRPLARFLLDENRSSNVEKLFAGKAAAATPAPAKPATGIYALDIRTVRVVKGELEFADLAMKPAFGTRMHDLNGSVLGISTRADRRATLAFAGEVDRYGDVRIKGALSPQAVTDDLDIALVFRNIPIHSLNPYSMSFAGWQVEDGRLSLDVNYQLDKRALKADNRVVIDSLKLGEELPDYKGTRLPLRLAVALLEDGDGRIDLNLPISGSLDDPEFSVGHLVWQAIKNVVTKVATAPFRALGALLGGEGFDAVYAVPGEVAVAPPEREKLDQLAAMLSKRPNLKLEIGGRYADVDRKELARSRIDRAILAAARFQLLPGEPLPLPDMGDAVIRDAVKAVYVDKIGRIKLMQRLLSLPDNDKRYAALRDELIAGTPVTDSELAALATARAEAVRAIMLTTDAALAARVDFGAPQKVGSDANGVELAIKLDSTAN